LSAAVNESNEQAEADQGKSLILYTSLIIH
jgi:hypothetical protein